MKVRDVMTRSVVGVAPDAPVKEAARLMERHDVSGLPVVDETGAVVGVLSEADLLLKEAGTRASTKRRFGWLLGEADRASQAKASGASVREAMSSPAVTTGPDEPVRRAARLMVERRINRLPVVSGGQLVGIITRADVGRLFVRPDAEIEREVRSEIDRCTLGAELNGLEVVVQEGVVRACGHVDRRSVAQVLESVIRRMDGVVASETSFTWRFDDSRPLRADQDYVAALWGRLR